ncbi:MAG: xanthine dehydrogenase family protein molybdopterin-binding subunit, partial [Acidimicrobiia bacterium]
MDRWDDTAIAQARPTPGSLLGNAVPRIEDRSILLGRSGYVDDLRVDGLLHLEFVRSTLAHGRLLAVETSEAVKMPGVVAVFAAADLALAPLRPMGGSDDRCARPPLAEGKVRFVGDPVAVVVAETKAAAVDAAATVEVDYDPLPAVADMEAAVEPGAPLQFEALGTNVSSGHRDPDDDPLEGAEVVVRGRFENQRVAVMPMEGNAVAVIPGDDGDGHDLTVYVATQMPHGFRTSLCELFELPPDRVRVVAPDVGGAFGAKIGVGAEHAVAVTVARRLERPVKWVETRSENLVAMPHGRGQVQYVELGLRRDGTITGLRCRILGDGGAYAGFGGVLPQWTTRMMAQGPYRIPRVRFDAAAVLTNTTPMGAFRGAGRPEAAAMLERVTDMAAAELGLDPVELRRRNLLDPGAFPHQTLMGVTYDSGDYATALDEALRRAGYEKLRADQAERRRRDDRVQLGIGVSIYVEITAGGGGGEFGSVEIHEDDTVTVKAGTSGHGQGHATSFAMIVADQLKVPLEAIRYVQSDTAAVPRGGGTGGSRSLQAGGSAVQGATEAVLEQARDLAAQLLEAAPSDIVVTDGGRIGVAGVPARSFGWGELARAAADQDGALSAVFDFTQAGSTFPFGAHVAVVEVDTETGAVRPVRHVAVDDCGRILNPLIVAGQQHGGIAQGMAQALWEQVVYAADGTPLTTTLLDYAMPSAAEMPSFEAANTETPTPLNPLGAKGIGESGTVGSTPAVHNAVIDALSHLGIRHLDMP